MLGNVLVENDYLILTQGLLGRFKVTLKKRWYSRKASRTEGGCFMDVIDILVERGMKVEPGSSLFEEVALDFAEAISLPNSTQWQVYFDRTPREIASWYLN